MYSYSNQDWFHSNAMIFFYNIYCSLCDKVKPFIFQASSFFFTQLYTNNVQPCDIHHCHYFHMSPVTSPTWWEKTYIPNSKPPPHRQNVFCCQYSHSTMLLLTILLVVCVIKEVSHSMRLVYSSFRTIHRCVSDVQFCHV